MTRTVFTAMALSGCLVTASAFAQSPKTDSPAECPMHAEHTKDAHHAGVDERGDREMGFSHAKTTHHFLLAPDGGAIDVAANDTADAASRDQIREHLRTIARLFAEGNFDMPAAIHDRVPPGVETMQRLRSEITYTYEETPRGGRVRITTSNPDALAAVHEFLRFQIEDHRTGDPLDVRAI